ncbi:hypothetical protein ACN47E_003753 [Coniothyrium glycines]
MPARKALQISATPFKPSFLSIPPSPFSPRAPLTPIQPPKPSPTHISTQARRKFRPATEAPPSPLRWIWKCHQCRTSYPLGTTRRCLEDGHYFCSGISSTSQWRQPLSSKKSKKHRACGSEFDYQGWKTRAHWRRGNTRQHAAVTQQRKKKKNNDKKEKQKDCWNTCDYPSECRWGKQFGVCSPVENDFSSTTTAAMTLLTAPLDTCVALERKDEDFWDAILASAERRKGGEARVSSPLSVIPEEAEMTESTAQVMADALPGEEIGVDMDGDVLMTDSAAVMAQNGTVTVTVGEASPAIKSLRATMARRKSRRRSSSQRVVGSETVDDTPPELISVGRVEYLQEQIASESLPLLQRVSSREAR